MSRCHVCGRPCVREVEPAVGDQAAVLEDEIYQVVLRNRMVFDACLACWMKWPDDWKRWPALVDEDAVPDPHGTVCLADIVDLPSLLRETA